MNRRNWILAGSGVRSGGWRGLAAVAQRWPANRDRTSVGGRLSTPVALDEATTAFWRASFTQPDGAMLAMASLLGQPLVLNFWATWCPPCVKEMPELDRFAKIFAARGGRVLGLAVDNPTAVRAHLQRAPVSYAIGMAGFDGTDLSRKLGNSTGALPYTAVFARSGAVVQRKLGETTFDQLSGWATAL